MADEYKLAKASWGEITGFQNGGSFYMPNSWDKINQAHGLVPEKLMVPEGYHDRIRMIYDFYNRGGLVGTVLDRLTELSITRVRNGQRKTSDESNNYYNVILRRQPSRLMRFLHTVALDYWISGMALPRVDWKQMNGEDLSVILKPSRAYWVPIVDNYAPVLVEVTWNGWGKKAYWLKLPKEELRLIRQKGKGIKDGDARYRQWLEQNPSLVTDIQNGAEKVLITDTDPILRKEVSFSPYPTPYVTKVLEPLIFKQQMRRMDFAVATRIINAILLVQEGDKDFPLTEETRGNLDELKSQLLARSNSPLLMERLFILFSNHTTKLTWITPDVESLLNQEKYSQTNDEILEGLGFPRILIVGESKNASASDISTWAIQPQMEEFRDMLIEWMTDLYEEAADRNNFRKVPVPSFTPIKLQDSIKTAAVFAQAFREGNVSRTTRNEMLGLDFNNEVELMIDEKEIMDDLPEDFPEMPYNIQVPPANAGQGGFQWKSRNTGRTPGTKNAPITKKNTGVNPPGQQPVSRTLQPKNDRTTTNQRAAEVEMLSDEEVINLIDRIAEARGIIVDIEDILNQKELS